MGSMAGGRSRKWIAVAIAAAIFAALLVALPFVVDVNRYRELIERRAEETLGRDVRLGTMRLSLLPLGVRVDDVALAALPAEGGGDLLKIDRVRVGARLMPLLAKRLEVTGIVLDRLAMTLERGADGRWNVERLVAGGGGQRIPGGDATSGGGPSVLVDSLRVKDGRIVVRDRAQKPPLELTLAGLDLSLRDVGLDRPVGIDLSATIEPADGAGRGRLGVAGRVGPPAAGEMGIPLELSIRAQEIPGSLLDRLTAMLGIAAAVSGASLTADLSGSVPGACEVRGSLELSGAEIRGVSPDGKMRKTSADVEIGYDVAFGEGGTLVDLRRVELSLWKSRLTLHGTVRRGAGAPVVDLTIGPASVAAEDLAAMAALALGELPVSFASPTPLELSLTARGPAGDGRLPLLAGSVRLRDFTFRHPSMSRPLERVAADVTLGGEGLDVGGLSGVLGSSDISGTLSVRGFGAPKVRFDLAAKHADIGEMFSFLQPEGEAAGSAAPGTGAGGSPALAIEGTLRIEQGSFQTLDFADLSTTMRYDAGVVKLDPVAMKLYGGTFRGTVQSDVSRQPPTFTVNGDAREVDLAAFLADNLDSSDLLAGRFTGRVDAAGSGLDYAAIVRSLDGKGAIEVTQGTVGRLDVLARLSKVSGLFGEATVKQLSGRVATEGTGFSRLAGKLRLQGGTMKLRELLLDSPDFRIDGEADVDLLAARLKGDFRLVLSQAVSEAMRREKSKAGELFWNQKTSRVELPFSLSGPFDEPSASVDFEAVARRAATGKVEAGARKLVSDKLGLDLGGGGSDSEAPLAAAAVSSDGAAEITRAGWGGPPLVRDLEIEGAVLTAGIKKAKLSVVDAGGAEIHGGRIDEVERALAGDRPKRRVTFRVEIDGKKLLTARMPLAVRLVVTHGDGTTSEAALAADR